jgi:hypothetical protein
MRRFQTFRTLLTVIALCLLTACGGNSMTGTVKGASLEPKEALFFLWFGQPLPFIVLSDQTGMCDRLKANQVPRNATLLYLVVADINSDWSYNPPQPAKYPLRTDSVDGKTSTAVFDKQDDTCTSAIGGSVTANSGTVELTSYNYHSSTTSQPSGSTSGTFDLMFYMDHVTGSFSASYCPVTGIPVSPTCI